MNAIFKGAVGFVLAYLALMVPTYILLYFGSTSAIVGSLGAALGHRTTPQFWMHTWCLVLMVLATSIRGKYIGKRWLVIFPVLAGFFDLVPSLSVIPLVPTVMHLLALMLATNGAANAVPSGDADGFGSASNADQAF